MKIKLGLILILISSFIIRCKKQECTPICPAMLYPPIMVSFKDSSGKIISVNNFSAIIRRSNKSTYGSLNNVGASLGFYIVASAEDKNTLREDGDVIDVRGTNPNTNQTKTTKFVLSGGPCSCLISKISGPDEIIFD